MPPLAASLPLQLMAGPKNFSLGQQRAFCTLERNVIFWIPILFPLPE